VRIDTEEALKELAEKRAALVAAVPEYKSGLAWCRAHSDLCDKAVRLLFDEASRNYEGAPPVAVVATGGYGRRELAPFSDIDITVVPKDETSPILDPFIRELFQLLHGAFSTFFRLEVGYAYRLLGDMPAIDARTRTGLLDARLVVGSVDLHRTLMESLWDTFAAGDFLLDKVRERDEMRRKYNDTALVVEPNLKEGEGGLRSFQCANWIRLAIGERAVPGTPEYDSILQYRNLLHHISCKRNDSLTRAKQADLADLLGVDPYILSSNVAYCLLALSKEYELGLERLQESRFSLAHGVISIRGEARVLPEADAGDAAVGVAIATNLGLGVSDLPIATKDEVDGPAAMYAVSTGEDTLRNLDRCGLLEKLLPELTRCRTLMPRDSVHQYTVFEHTLRTIRNLDSIEAGTFLGTVMEGLNDPSLLYLGALLHDVGKFERGRPHSESGADMAREVCQRWGLGQRDTEHVVWLVREHLTMAHFIRVRDIEQPSTINEFAETVKDSERLGSLTLLTWADVNAVSHSVWSPAQDAFLRELYRRTAEVLEGEPVPELDTTQYRQKLKRQLSQEQIPDEEIAAFVQSLPAHYLTTAPPELVKLHLSYVRKATVGETTIDFSHRSELSATELTVCTADSPGLLSRLLGVLYALEISVSDIRAATTKTETPVALDVFTISLGSKPVPAATCRQISSAMKAIVSGERSVESLLLDKGKDPELRQRVFSYEFFEGEPGVLEFQAARGRGVAYRLSRLIASMGWRTVTARLSQWAGQSAAAFYILGSHDQPLTQEEVRRALDDSGKTN
jgi:[protein-PII] uridylyltransferase